MVIARVAPSDFDVQIVVIGIREELTVLIFCILDEILLSKKKNRRGSQTRPTVVAVAEYRCALNRCSISTTTKFDVAAGQTKSLYYIWPSQIDHTLP